MKQFDVYPTVEGVPLVILQSDYHDGDVASRIVAPLVRELDIKRSSQRIDIPVLIDGVAYRARMNQLGAVEVRVFGAEPIANIANQRDEFIRAVDLVFSGF